MRLDKRDVYPDVTLVNCPLCDCCALGPDNVDDPEQVCGGRAPCGIGRWGSRECEPCVPRNRAASGLPTDPWRDT